MNSSSQCQQCSIWPQVDDTQYHLLAATGDQSNSSRELPRCDLSSKIADNNPDLSYPVDKISVNDAIGSAVSVMKGLVSSSLSVNDSTMNSVLVDSLSESDNSSDSDYIRLVNRLLLKSIVVATKGFIPISINNYSSMKPSTASIRLLSENRPCKVFTNQSKLSERCTDQSKPSEACTDQSNVIEGCTDQSKVIEGCTDQSKLSEGRTDQSKLSEGRTDQSKLPDEGCSDQSKVIERYTGKLERVHSLRRHHKAKRHNRKQHGKKRNDKRSDDQEKHNQKCRDKSFEDYNIMTREMMQKLVNVENRDACKHVDDDICHVIYQHRSPINNTLVNIRIESNEFLHTSDRSIDMNLRQTSDRFIDMNLLHTSDPSIDMNLRQASDPSIDVNLRQTSDPSIDMNLLCFYLISFI